MIINLCQKSKEYNGNILNSSIKEFYVLRNGIEKCASLSNFFIGFSELSIVNVHYLDTCNVTNMSLCLMDVLHYKYYLI